MSQLDQTAPRAVADPTFKDRPSTTRVELRSRGAAGETDSYLQLDLSDPELDLSGLCTVAGSAINLAEIIVTQLRDGTCPPVLYVSGVSPSLTTALRTESRAKLKHLGKRIAILPNHPDDKNAYAPHPFKYITIKDLSE